MHAGTSIWVYMLFDTHLHLKCVCMCVCVSHAATHLFDRLQSSVRESKTDVRSLVCLKGLTFRRHRPRFPIYTQVVLSVRICELELVSVSLCL